MKHPAEVEAILTYVLDGRVSAFKSEPFGVLQFGIKTALGENSHKQILAQAVSHDLMQAIGRIDLGLPEEEIRTAITTARDTARGK